MVTAAATSATSSGAMTRSNQTGGRTGSSLPRSRDHTEARFDQAADPGLDRERAARVVLAGRSIATAKADQGDEQRPSPGRRMQARRLSTGIRCADRSPSGVMEHRQP
jgi:hypothetical protein